MNRGVRLAAASFALIAAAPPTGTSVSVTVIGLRSAKGVVRACLTSQAKGFPECHEQAGDIARIAPANAPVRMGPPPFAKAAFAVMDSPIHLTIRMRYMF